MIPAVSGRLPRTSTTASAASRAKPTSGAIHMTAAWTGRQAGSASAPWAATNRPAMPMSSAASVWPVASATMPSTPRIDSHASIPRGNPRGRSGSAVKGEVVANVAGSTYSKTGGGVAVTVGSGAGTAGAETGSAGAAGTGVASASGGGAGTGAGPVPGGGSAPA